MDIVAEWLSRYPWFAKLPKNWKQITHRLVVELSAEKFVGLSALHEALEMQDLDAVWDALEGVDIPDRAVDVIDVLARG